MKGYARILLACDLVMLLVLSAEGVWRVLIHGWWEREQIILGGALALAALLIASLALHRPFPGTARVIRVAVAVLGGSLLIAAQLPQFT